MRLAISRTRSVAAVTALALTWGVADPAVAKDNATQAVPSFVEPLYDPAVGSRWIVESDSRTEETKTDGPKTLNARTRAELTIESKTPDGYRITYVQRGIAIDGTSPSVALLRLSMSPLENLIIRATTDRSGKPLMVENLAEVRTAMLSMRDNMLKPFENKPKVAEILHQVMTSLIEVDASKAAATYIDNVPSLAKTQNTGMKPGEIRRASDVVANPLGGSQLKSNVMLHLVSADVQSGRAQYVHTRSYDQDSMKESISGITGQMMAATGEKVTSEQMAKLMKSITLTLDERAVSDVEGGMTRRIEETTNTVASAAGHTFTKRQVKIVTVTPAR